MATKHPTPHVAAGMPTGALHPVASSRLNKPAGRPDMVAVGTWVWLASELMFFAALFAAYFSIRNVTNSAAAAAGTESLWQQSTQHLNFTFAGINTIILVLSSVTCQMGVHAAEHYRVRREGSIFQILKWGMREWYTLTFVMGAVFVAGQLTEYFELFSEGFNIATNSYWSAFFLATGFHGLHVFGGLIAFLFVIGRSFMARTYTHEQSVAAMGVSYYWHFVDVIWIVLFAVLYILK